MEWQHRLRVLVGAVPGVLAVLLIVAVLYGADPVAETLTRALLY